MPFFQKAIKAGEEELEQHVDQEANSSMNWLTRLSTNHRRPSGFAGDFAGTSFIDDDNSNSFQEQGHGSRMLVPKSLFGVGTSNIDTPTPGEDSVFSIAVNSEKNQLTLIQENTTEFMDTNTATLQSSASNHQLSELVTSGQFTVATQESLEQLKSMRERLDHQKGDHDMFEMDDDDDFKHKSKMPMPAPSGPVEKPPGKIMSKIMQSGLAQNWFFKNPDAEHEESEPGSRKTSANSSHTAPVIVVEDANAMWDYPQGQKLQKSSSATGFTGLLDKSSKKKKTEDRVTNFMAPQNF